MFTHKGALACDGQHAAVEQARECEDVAATAEWEAQVGCCPVCDGLGHGEATCGLVNSQVAWAEHERDRLIEAGLVAAPW